MATLTVIVWFLSMFISFGIFANASEAGDEDKAFGCFGALAVVSLIVAGAIYWDITGALPGYGGRVSILGLMNLRFLLIAGLVSNGLLGILGLMFAGAAGGGGSRAAGSFILNAIGLLSSILGIVSFYLDYLR